jgi:peptidyl-prolyl cis-trans isomerase SurA
MPDTHPSMIDWRRQIVTAIMAVALVAFTHGTAAAQQVVAVVNGELITAFDIEQRSKLIQLSSQKAPPRQEVLEELIDEKVKLSVIKRWTMDVPDKEVESSYSSMARRMQMTPAQLTEVLAKSGIRTSTLKSRIKADIIWTGIVRSKYQSSMQVDEKEIRAALESRPKDDKTAVGHDYTLRPILFIIPRGSAGAVIEGRKREAEALRARFEGCDEGIALARTLRDVAVKSPVHRNSSDLAPALREILDGVTVGKLTPPEVTQQGVELFALCGKRQTTTDTPAQRQVREEMMQERFQTFSKRFLKEMRSAALIEYKQ